MKSQIVIGSCFGDEGKGITTDFLCKRNPFGTIVVRFSGGHQAGHNVKIGKLSHVHSNYGSGTLRGVPSYYSEHCTIYPVTMLNEKNVLLTKHIDPILILHPMVKLATPADVAYNRVTEKRLKHGSCGLGVSATMKRNETSGYKSYGMDLLNPSLLEAKITHISMYYREMLEENKEDIPEYWTIYNNELTKFEEAIKILSFNIEEYDYLRYFDTLIFEGSQGIMLDMNYGIFPNVTYTNTTSKNAIEICQKLNISDIELFYVTRCYQTRHGMGWMSNETPIKLTNTQDEINTFNDWQKDFRIGEIDYELLNYAHSIDDLYSKDIPKNLVITCLDQRPGFEFEHNRLKTRFKQIYNSYSADSKAFISLGSGVCLNTY
jgi:adenylosuccinate synthase